MYLNKVNFQKDDATPEDKPKELTHEVPTPKTTADLELVQKIIQILALMILGD